jgi:N-sulfoglucosamine sulfohydrolase
MADYVFRPRYELYDLQNDPGELTNLAESPEHRATFDLLAKELKEFQRRTKDPWFVKYTYE